MNEKDNRLFETRLHLNIIINIISRINKILNSLVSTLVYEQNLYFASLDGLYRQLILKLLECKNIVIKGSENEELMNLIIESELFNFKNLHCYHDYFLISETNNLLDSMLWPILRKVESMSSKYEIKEGMYYLKEFPLDLVKAKDRKSVV